MKKLFQDKRYIEQNIKPTTIFLDAADTLFYIKEGLGETYARPARKYGINPHPSDIEKSFSQHFKSSPPLAFPDINPTQRKHLEKRWWYNVVKKVFEDVGMFSQFDQYFEELFEIFRKEAWELFPESKEILQKLKEQGLKLVIVSNFDSRVYDVCKELDIFDLIDDFVISSEVGYAKPSPMIFEHALNRHKIKAEETIHTGDDIENDYLCPKSIGINAILLDRKNKITSETLPRVKDLKEFSEYINQK